jgi:peptidoglycan/xylan/chitin deacetylase (PgdA/CDA1 family)
MKIKSILFIGLVVLLSGCSQPAVPTVTETPAPSETASLRPTVTRAPTSTPDLTLSITPTDTQVPTSTIAPTPTWSVVGPGDVTAPILLYHHIDPDLDSPLYNVPPDQFAAQMQALSDWGYTTITISQLVAAITEGAVLPPRPIVITFDDGQMSVYNYAFPIMQRYGFVGVNYLVANRLEADGFLSLTELDQLYAAGWEVGSHSYTHVDLTLDHTAAFNEMRYSMIDLGAALSQPVNTFAYPFGSVDSYLYERAENWGYTAAVGLGKAYVHNQYSLYYLSRIEVKQEYSLEEFGDLLPWSSPPE